MGIIVGNRKSEIESGTVIKLLQLRGSRCVMPSLPELAVLRAAALEPEGAIFKVDQKAFARCVVSGWLTKEGELTNAGRKLLLEETSGKD
jgi:hypothetical protein